MGDLKDPRWIYLKGALFLVIVLGAAGLIIAESPRWPVVVLVGLLVWASARLYYFMFYVIEKYVDSEYRFAGVLSFVRYVISRRRETNQSDDASKDHHATQD